MLARSDFRLHKVRTGYKISQRVGSGWELFSEVHPSRADALAYIKELCK